LNAVEIEEAVSKLADQPFDAANFPYLFLEAFGNKATTIQRLRSGSSNKSDIDGGVLQHNNIHIAVAQPGKTHETLAILRESPATVRQKAKFILATDGNDFQAEDLTSNISPIVCEYKNFPDHFGFFLPLAGISTVEQIRESSFDIKATGRLNRLYVELLKDNPKWGTIERRHDMNHFMARLIFCFFAEDTEIFNEVSLFTKTVEQMSASDSSNTHEVIGEIFRAMNTTWSARGRAQLPRWADFFPYVNGGLFSGSTEVPRFSKISRAYLLNIGKLDWKKINPDIFGSMIQAVAEDEERGALGMHYTSVSNIRRVLNPLFLDDLRSQLDKAGDNQRMLLNLRKRISKIRVFDPACGSGNFLVIAYKDMREIEGEINKRRNEGHLKSEISLTNFRGIELRDFPAEVARLALIIAEYQCDVLYRGQKEALVEFLPLESDNWITCGNALSIDWLQVCPPINEAEEGETFVCGNPPYKGGTEQTKDQKNDMSIVFSEYSTVWKSLDYVCGWFFKFAKFSQSMNSSCAFVSTNSIAQGEQVARLWPLIFNLNLEITFAHTSFKWANLAAHNAGVMVVIIGIGRKNSRALLIEHDSEETSVQREVDNISPYLVAHKNTIIAAESKPISSITEMVNGSKPADGGFLILTQNDAVLFINEEPEAQPFIRRFVGSADSIQGNRRFCLWILEKELAKVKKIKNIYERISSVKDFRQKSKKELTQKGASTAWAFQQVRQQGNERIILVPRVSSESRPYLPISLFQEGTIVGDGAFALYDAPLWNFAILCSKLHLVWIATVCGRLKTDFRYSSTLGWNTFPVPKLTEKNKKDLIRCAEDILLAREVNFPSSLADLYDPEVMPEELRRAHERNDEVLERIYIGRRFKNDSERLEKLFEQYTKMTATADHSPTIKRKSKKKETQV